MGPKRSKGFTSEQHYLQQCWVLPLSWTAVCIISWFTCTRNPCYCFLFNHILFVQPFFVAFTQLLFVLSFCVLLPFQVRVDPSDVTTCSLTSTTLFVNTLIFSCFPFSPASRQKFRQMSILSSHLTIRYFLIFRVFSFSLTSSYPVHIISHHSTLILSTPCL